MTVIGLHGVGKDYGATTAVDSIDLSIRTGDLFFLLGPSGCGKTTLLRMIAGFVEPTRGRIVFGNRDVTDLPPNRRNAGMVFQSYALWPHMTVLENVLFGLQVRRVPRAEQRRRGMAALDRVRMGEHADRRPNQLSGGQQQRVALARALVIEPTVLLLDEPLSNLDAKLRTDMRSEIRGLCKSLGITTVYVTHDQKEALSMADEMAVLRHGRVVQQGRPADVYRQPRTRFVADFLGETNFVPGTVVECRAGLVVADTAAGRVASALPPGAAPACRPGDPLLLSIRPEAIRLGRQVPRDAGGVVLQGTRVATTFLGEAAQHTIRLGGELCVRVVEQNPRTHDILDVFVSIDHEDIVIVADE